MKLWKKVAIGTGVVFGALVVFDVTGRALFPEKWAELDAKVEASKVQREEQRKQAEAQKPKQTSAGKTTSGKPTGAMYMGGIVAIDLANSGGIKPTKESLDALARQAATKNEVFDPTERSRFVRDFEFGFLQGWKTATK
jgi:hypothetical protein